MNNAGQTPFEYLKLIRVEDRGLFRVLGDAGGGPAAGPSFLQFLMTGGGLSAILGCAVLAGAVAYWAALQQEEEEAFYPTGLS